MTNNYKQDGDKPPVLDAVHIPFRRALLAVARMCEDMKARHKLDGAKDPFQEWRQLPDARRRLANAAARHGLNPWAVNAKDGAHLHATHALWGWLAAVELWEEEQEKIDAEAPCCGAPDADDGPAAELHRAPPAPPANVKDAVSPWNGRQGAQAAIMGPAGADWRESSNVDRCLCGHMRLSHLQRKGYCGLAICTCPEFREE